MWAASKPSRHVGPGPFGDEGIYSVFQRNADTLKSRCYLPFVDRANKHERLTQDVLVSQQHRVVDLRLSEPGLLVSGRENLDCNVLSLPLTPPHFTVTALAWGGGRDTGKNRQLK